MFHSKCNAKIEHLESQLRERDKQLEYSQAACRKQREKVNIQTYIAMLGDTVKSLNYVLERLEGQK